MKVSQLLSEADVSLPLELHDVVKFFPNTYKRVMSAKWGMDHPGTLMYHGHPFFASEEGETAYDHIEAAVKNILDDEEFGVEVNLTMDLRHLDSDDDLQKDSHDFTFEAKVSDSQEVYLGYSPHDDALFVGYDVWIDEESFNEAWDREFREATGEEYDSDNPDHEAVFNGVWDHMKNDMFFGMLFEVKEQGGHWVAEEVSTRQGGFYKGIYRGDQHFKSLDLIDLRLS